MRDGAVYKRVQAFHKGHPNMMMDRGEFRELFLEQTRLTLAPRQAERLYHAVLHLDEAGGMAEISGILREKRK